MQIQSASRSATQPIAVKTSRLSPLAAAGIRYERRVKKGLEILAKEQGLILEYQPSFRFVRGISSTSEYCIPDFILRDSETYLVIVIDAKLNFTEAGRVKLTNLYLPIINEALRPGIIRSMLVVKNLLPNCPPPINSLGIDRGTELSVFSAPVYHYPGLAPFVW